MSAFPTCLRALVGAVAPAESYALSVCVGRLADAETRHAVQLLLDAICATYPRTPLFALGRSPHAGRLTRRLPMPWPLDSVARRYLKCSQTRLLLLAGQSSMAHALVRAARRRSVGIVTVEAGHGHGLQALRMPSDLHLRLDGERWLLDARNQPTQAVTLPVATARVATLFATNPQDLATQRGLAAPSLVESAGFDEMPARLQALRDRLGPFDGILCLGNGPSSEEPALTLDVVGRMLVFRVNASWQSRATRFKSPDLVFTAQAGAIGMLAPPAGFVLKTIAEEESLATALVGKPYSVAERIGSFVPADFGRYAPTHGAVMVATAALLQPSHLVIAGMDLFAHAAGAYPQDSLTVNDYTLGHDRDAELAYLRAALTVYRGELLVRSPPLADALRVEHALPGIEDGPGG